MEYDKFNKMQKINSDFDKLIADTKLNNLHGIRRDSSKCGIYKRWIYKKVDYNKMCDYMQKINYSIQDLNSTIDNLKKFDRRNIVYIISLVDWIREAFNAIIGVINSKVISNFRFLKQEELKRHSEYFRAIRSFVVAHPLNTTSHKEYGLDGNFICVDIREDIGLFSLVKMPDKYVLTIDGLKKENCSNMDFYLYCYSDKDDNMSHFNRVGCRYSDIYETAKLYIEKLYALDNYLTKNARKKDYE